MSKLWPFVKYWFPVLVWMGVIFSASSDRMSLEHSSRIIGPIVRYLFPHLSNEAVRATVFTVRKFAHLTEYAILAVLLWQTQDKPIRGALRPWKPSTAWFALSIATLYAVTDEFHQTFVPTRQGSVWDVLLDSAGAATGLFFVWCWKRWRESS